MARIRAQSLLSNPYRPMVLYIGTARKAAGIKYVNSARFITSRPPFMRRREMAKAAAEAIIRVRTAVAQEIASEFHIWRQKL